MPIASIGTIVLVTPSEEFQVVWGKDEYEFDMISDLSPFRVKVSDLLTEDGALIGVAGPVISGHARFRGKIATLLTRLDNSHWETDMRSATNFKVGTTVAHRIRDFPYTHPEGTTIDVFPFFSRHGSISAESSD